MKKIFLLLLLCASFFAEAQFTVKLVVTDIATKKNDDVYLTGTMNNWDPHQSGSDQRRTRHSEQNHAHQCRHNHQFDH